MKKAVISTVFMGLMIAPALWAAPAASAAPPTRGCDQALENDGDPYDSTCDGSPSLNGNGNGNANGNANGKPCAGCVGAADNKNPKGQLPNGTDPNNGYECDGNNGIGQTNPAHTGCEPYSGTPLSNNTKKLSGNTTSFVAPEIERGVPAGVVFAGAALLIVMITLSRTLARRGLRSR